MRILRVKKERREINEELNISGAERISNKEDGLGEDIIREDIT